MVILIVCSYFSSRKSVQDITQEIINILNMYEYPEIPFTPSSGNWKTIDEFERVQFVLFFLQERIDLWYIARKFENWKCKAHDLSQQVFLRLKSSRVQKIPLLSLWEGDTQSKRYYDAVFECYITDLKRIIAALTEWLYFLFTLECRKYHEENVHYSLKEIFCQEIGQNIEDQKS